MFSDSVSHVWDGEGDDDACDNVEHADPAGFFVVDAERLKVEDNDRWPGAGNASGQRVTDRAKPYIPAKYLGSDGGKLCDNLTLRTCWSPTLLDRQRSLGRDLPILRMFIL